MEGWRPSVFISYSSRDARAFAELEILLKPLQKTHGLLQTWSDRCITPGAEWDKQIRAELERADVVLMLVSRHFLATDYITDIEIIRAMERAEAGQCLLVSVILENCGWEKMAFSKYQALPTKAKPILDYKPQRKGWEQVRERLHTLLKGLCDTPRPERHTKGRHTKE